MTSAITRRMRRRSPTPNMMRCASAMPPSRRGFRTWSGRTRRAAGSVPPPAEKFAKVRHACRCSRSATCSRTRRWSDFADRDPPLPRPVRRRDARLHGRAEDRRPVLLAALRGRAPGQWRDPRRRLRRRGRHRQCPHHRRGPRAASRPPRPRRLRGARRGLYEPRRLLRPQRAPGRGRQAGVRQSAQCRRRLAAPARPRHHRGAAARVSSPMPGAR